MLIPRQTVALGRIATKHVNTPAACAIRIERGSAGPRAIATDGRRAIIFSWDEPDAKDYPPIAGMNAAVVSDFAANVPPRALADTVRGIPNRCPKPILQYVLLDESNPQTLHLATTDLENVTRAEAKAEEGDYPPVEDVIPRPERQGNVYDPKSSLELPFTHVRIAMNGKQLAETVATLVDLASEDASNAVLLTVPVSGIHPLRLDVRSPERRAVGVIMPVNVVFADYEESKAPAAKAKAHGIAPNVPANNGHARTEPAAQRSNGHAARTEPKTQPTNGHATRIEPKPQATNGHAARIEPKPQTSNGHAAGAEPARTTNGQVATAQPPVKPERRKRRFLLDLW